MGVSAARLSPGLVHPELQGYTMVARGGPTHASCAVIWRNTAPYHFLEINDVGGGRRIWILVRGHRGSLCALIFYYLPPPGGAAAELEWAAEIGGIRNDIGVIRGRHGHIHMLAMGDANVQPGELSGAPDPHPRRDVLLVQLHSGMGFVLLNPHVRGDSREPVRLPIRQLDIDIRTGDTRHSGGASRAIDLAAATSNTTATMQVHNSRHCVHTGGCP